MYYKAFYHNMKGYEIIEALLKEGFNPIRIQDEAGYVYPLHKHPETKLLVFLKGNMEIKVGKVTYQCSKGDKVIIPGNVEHSAHVGTEGCEFFWSEKIV